MRCLIIALLFILLPLPLCSQTFLKAYEKYRLQKANKLPDPQTRKMTKKYIKSEVVELDTIFQSYKTKTGFDFNTADTLFLIYEAPAEAPFTSTVIIWSGKDTLCYKQGLGERSAAGYKRVITYKPLAPATEAPLGYRAITESDSLIRLVANRDFATINHLSDGQDINDGSIVRIYVAYKQQGQYILEYCLPPAFVIPTDYRK